MTNKLTEQWTVARTNDGQKKLSPIAGVGFPTRKSARHWCRKNWVRYDADLYLLPPEGLPEKFVSAEVLP